MKSSLGEILNHRIINFIFLIFQHLIGQILYSLIDYIFFIYILIIYIQLFNKLKMSRNQIYSYNSARRNKSTVINPKHIQIKRIQFPTHGDSNYYQGYGKKHYWNYNIVGRYGIAQSQSDQYLRPIQKYRKKLKQAEAFTHQNYNKMIQNYHQPQQYVNRQFTLNKNEKNQFNINPEQIRIEIPTFHNKLKSINDQQIQYEIADNLKIRNKTELSQNSYYQHPPTPLKTHLNPQNFLKPTQTLIQDPKSKILKLPSIPNVHQILEQTILQSGTQKLKNQNQQNHQKIDQKRNFKFLQRQARKISPTFVSSLNNPLLNFYERKIMI